MFTYKNFFARLFSSGRPTHTPPTQPQQSKSINHGDELGHSGREERRGWRGEEKEGNIFCCDFGPVPISMISADSVIRRRERRRRSCGMRYIDESDKQKTCTDYMLGDEEVEKGEGEEKARKEEGGVQG